MRNVRVNVKSVEDFGGGNVGRMLLETLAAAEASLLELRERLALIGHDVEARTRRVAALRTAIDVLEEAEGTLGQEEGQSSSIVDTRRGATVS